MATRLRIANKAQTSVVTLNDTAGTLVYRDWITMPTGDGLINETLTIVAQGSDASIITAVNNLDEMETAAAKWHDDTNETSSIWLEVNATAENAKRSLIYGLNTMPVSMANLSPMLGGTAMFYNLAIDRHPLWENVAGTVFNASSVSVFGGIWTPSVPTGSAPGRIQRFEFRANAAGAGYTLANMWAGIRPVYGGTANFNPLIEMEAGSQFNGGTAAATAGASNGTAVYVDSIASTMTLYADITLQNHDSGNEADYVGEYLVLGNVKVDSGTVGVQLKMNSGAAPSGTKTIDSEIVYITNTAFQLKELGSVSIPIMGGKVDTASAAMIYDNFNLYAQQISGTSDIWFDCLILIPSRHMVKCTGSSTYYVSAADRRPAVFYTHENDDNQIIYETGASATPSAVLDGAVQNLEWPTGGGVIVVAGDRAGSAVVTDVIDLRMTVYPRWHNHRET